MKVNKLKKLKCLKVKVTQTDSEAVNGTQNVIINTPSNEQHQQFHLSVINSTLSEERTDSASSPSIQKNNNLSSDNENLWYSREVDNTSRKSSSMNGELPCVHIVSDENTVNRPTHSPVPGMVEQSSNDYRTSVESGDSQSAVLQHSSHQQLVEIEDAREACVSMKN